MCDQTIAKQVRDVRIFLFHGKVDMWKWTCEGRAISSCVIECAYNLFVLPNVLYYHCNFNSQHKQDYEAYIVKVSSAT